MFMFFKVLKPLVLPPTLIFIGLLISVIFIFRKRTRWAKIFLIFTVVVYYALFLEPVAYLLARSLERNGDRAVEVFTETPEAIVILAGGADKSEGARPFPELGGASWRRLWHGLEIYRSLDGKVPLLYVGGSGDPFDPVSGEAELGKSYAIAMGIPEDLFWTESSSRDTYENGLAVKQYLDARQSGVKKHRIILVTSARHMPRALGVMKKIGISAVASPADFAVGAYRFTPLSIFPSASGFSLSVSSIHEWIGIIGYKLKDRL